MLESREKREKREKEGLWLHDMIAPCGVSLADVWTRKSRVLAVAAELAGSTFVPKREKGKGWGFSSECLTLVRVERTEVSAVSACERSTR